MAFATVIDIGRSPGRPGVAGLPPLQDHNWAVKFGGRMGDLLLVIGILLRVIRTVGAVLSIWVIVEVEVEIAALALVFVAAAVVGAMLIGTNE